MRPKGVAEGSRVDKAAHTLDEYYRYIYYVGDNPSGAHYDDAKQLLKLRFGGALIDSMQLVLDKLHEMDNDIKEALGDAG